MRVRHPGVLDGDVVEPACYEFRIRGLLGERMLASFAPVGQTGYVVAVATPYQNAQRPNQRLLNLLFTYGSVLNLCFVGIAMIAVWASLRQPRTVGARTG